MKTLSIFLISRIILKDRLSSLTRLFCNYWIAPFNDLGSPSFPIAWPKEDENVMSVKSEFPPSGHNELAYDNNYAHRDDYQFRIALETQTDIQCFDKQVQFSATYENTDYLNGIEWMPNTGLSCTNCTDPVLTLPDVERTQQVILTSEYFCKDTATLIIPKSRADVSKPIVTAIPEICLGANAPDLSDYVEGTDLIWYVSEADNDGKNTTPIINTSIPGNFSYWVSQANDDCESPRSEVTYTILDKFEPPVIDSLPNVCKGQSLPNLASFISGTDILWYLQATGGNGSLQAPIIDTNKPGSYQFWVSQGGGSCESPRTELSITIHNETRIPGVKDSLILCFGSESPSLVNLVYGADILWYTSAAGGVGNTTTPEINTNVSGSFTLWVSQLKNQCESERVPFSYTIMEQLDTPLVDFTIESCAGRLLPNFNSAVRGTDLLWYNYPNGPASASPQNVSTDEVGTFSLWVSQTIEGCESEKVEVPYTIHEIPAPPSVIDNVSVCVGESVTALEEFVEGKDLSWYEVPFDGEELPNTPFIETDTARTIQFWISQTVNNCESDRVPIEVWIREVSIEAEDYYQITEGNSVEIIATIQVHPNEDTFQVNWYDENNTIIESEHLNIIVSPDSPTQYYIVAESNGCMEEKTIVVDLIYQIDPTQLFTPNGDGQNDTWFIGDIDQYPESNVTVYNRWGSEVYQTNGYKNDWQGTWQDGSELPMATYYYVIDLNGNGAKVITGNVTIIR